MAQVSKYRYLLNQYPETVQKEQFRIICHISKRTARYLLQSGLVPCVQSGKKTRNYTIKMKDIVRYLERREIHPEKYKLPPGSYTRELDAFIEELVRCYGTERAMYVLSRTIQFSDWDARFDQAVLDRAGKTDFPDTREPREAHQVDPTTRYVTEIDPCVVNAVFVKLMELEDEQEETNHMNEIEQDELDEDMTAEL